jgi:hypothetical protein
MLPYNPGVSAIQRHHDGITPPDLHRVRTYPEESVAVSPTTLPLARTTWIFLVSAWLIMPTLWLM